VNKKIVIFGGCFPVQEQIKPELLYHNLIKEKMIKENHITFDFEIFRYDSFRQCAGFLKNTGEINPCCVLFHVRPDPYLNASKIYYRYIDYENKKRKKINIHLFGFKEPDINPVNFGNKILSGWLFKILYVFKKQIKRLLRNANYLSGYIIGNNMITKKQALKTINEIYLNLDNYNTRLIVQGPPMRPRSSVENLLLRKLDKYLAKNVKGNITYVQGFYNSDETGNYIFLNDKIHMNESGHRLYANLLYEEIKKTK
jgi:hypothetical protein